MNQGFSLIEVLVSLFLISFTSLVLLKQQWQVSYLFNQTKIRAKMLLQLDNATEELLVGNLNFKFPPPLEMTKTNNTKYVYLQVRWLQQSTIGRRVVVY